MTLNGVVDALDPGESPRMMRLGQVQWTYLNQDPPIILVDSRLMRWCGGSYVPEIGDTVVWVPIGSDPFAIGTLSAGPMNARMPVTWLRWTGSTQSIPTFSSTVISFAGGTEVSDPFNMHDPGSFPERIIIPTGFGGRYLVTMSMEWQAGVTAHAMAQFLAVSGATRYPMGTATENAGIVSPCCSGSMVVDLAAGDYITQEALHDFGSSRNVVSAQVQALYLGRSA